MNLSMSWGELARYAGGKLVRGNGGDLVRAISTDTRRLESGQAFWALSGERYDAHEFLDERLSRVADGWIVRRGFKPAAALPGHLVEVPEPLEALSELAACHRRRFDIPVVGITGSNGKTTVKEMLRAILSRVGQVCANEGNLNNQVGLPLSVLELTTEHRFAVFEMGASHPGDIRHLAKIAQPTLGVLTNIGLAHIEFFGSLENTFKVKTELIEGLPPKSSVVLNADDPYLARLLPGLGRRAFPFGRSREAKVRVAEAEPGRLELDLGECGTVSLKRDWIGRIHRMNAAAAAAAAMALGLNRQAIEEGLKAFIPAPMRFQPRRHSSGAWLVVDAYNANPDSMRAGIETFLETSPGKEKILVLGDMKELGLESARLHAELGLFLAKLPLTAVYLVGPDMAKACDALRNAKASFPVRHVGKPEDLAGEVRRALREGVSAYFKASRAMRLEELIEKL